MVPSRRSGGGGSSPLPLHLWVKELAARGFTDEALIPLVCEEDGVDEDTARQMVAFWLGRDASDERGARFTWGPGDVTVREEEP